MPNYVPTWRGWIQLKTTAPSGTAFAVPGVAMPANPFNKLSPDVVDFSGFETVEVLSKYTPSIRVIAYASPDWFLSANMNALIISVNNNPTTSPYGTNEWSVGLYSTYATRVWDKCKCAMVLIEQEAIGSPIKVTMDFLAIYGESMAPTPTTFSAPTVTGRQLTQVNQVDYASTLDQVNAMTIAIMRRQRYIPRNDGTLFMTDIASGKLGGSFAVDQSPSFTASPGLSSFGSATVKIGSAGSGVQFSLLLSSNGDNEPHTTDEARRVRAYSLRDMASGGNPITVTSF